jgi:DNA-binding MarR family transcriptional regulator
MQEIEKYLSNNGEASISKIAADVDMDRHRVSKELQLLRAKGKVTSRSKGPAKLWRPTRSVLQSLLDQDSAAAETTKTILSNLPGSITVNDRDNNVTWPDNTNTKCFEHRRNRDEQCTKCPVDTVRKTGETQTFTAYWGEEKTITLIPIQQGNNDIVVEHVI